jgi:glycosyltransferase involved in cell wall biosynthesis
MAAGDIDVPRCLFVDLSAGLGGASIRVLNLMHRIPAGRIALASLDRSPVSQQARSLGLPILPVGASRADLRIVSRLVQGIRDERFQLLDAQNPQSTLWGALAAERAGAACVVTHNSWASEEYRGDIRGWVYPQLSRWLRSRIDLHIAVSKDILDRLNDDGVPAGACALIPNAVSVEPEAVRDVRAPLKASLGLPEDAIVCCVVGRLVGAKAHEVLIASLALLARRHPRLHCLMVGDGPLRRTLERQVETGGLRGRVHFLGAHGRPEVLEIVKASHVFVMPSRSEGTPLALLEAAALARPVIATRVGGIPQLLTDMTEGILVDPGDPEALAEALERVLGDPVRAAALGAASQRRVVREFTLEAQVARTLDAYRTALARHERRASGSGWAGARARS